MNILNQVVHAIRSRVKKESGSAAIEFVVLAIPLFLPILIYITNFSEVSRTEIQSRNLIREIVRSYVSATSIPEAEANARYLLDLGGERVGFSRSEIASMKLTFTCSASPCLTAGERVRGELTVNVRSTSRQVHVSAQEYVSPWQ